MSLFRFLVLCYVSIFWYAYTNYINPTFEYAHYIYNVPTRETFIFTLICIYVPSFGLTIRGIPAEFGAIILYIIVFIPGIIILLFMWERDHAELMLVQSSLTLSMWILNCVASANNKVRTFDEDKIHKLILPNRKMDYAVGILTTISLIFVFLQYGNNLRFVSFSDVYDLRSDASALEESGGLANYAVMWLTYCFLPFYFAKGYLTKRWIYLIIALSGSLLIYMATGAKMAILLGLIIFIIFKLIQSGKSYANRLLLGLVLSITGILLVIPDNGAWVFLKSILLIRTLGAGGWTMATYYEYFDTYGFTFYSHIGPINTLFNNYPYGDYSLGQLIGIEYSGSAEANFNANFWASDGFAAAGLWGIVMITLVVSFVFFFVNQNYGNISSRFLSLWLTGFWLALTNLPLSVALFSGGGLIIFLLLFLHTDWFVLKIKKIHLFIIRTF